MTAFRPQISIRAIIVIASALLAVVAATGLVEAKAFLLPTPLKYSLTVGAPLFVFIAAQMEHPLRLVTALTVIAAPFVGATAQLAGTRVSVLVPLLVAGFALIALSDPVRGRPASLRWPALLVFPLLAIPLGIGSKGHGFVVSLALLIGVGWLVANTAGDEAGLRTVLIAVAIQVMIQGAVAIWGAETGRTLNLYSAAGTTQYGSNYAYTFEHVTRPTGTFGDPIGLGNALAIAIPLLLAFLVTLRSWTGRAFVVVALALGGTGLELALDRTAWIGAVIGALALALLLPRVLRRTALTALAASLVVLVAVALILDGPVISAKFSSIFDPTNTQGQTPSEQGEAAGEQERLQYWSIAFRDGFLDHPIAGIGIDNMGQLILDHSTGEGLGVRPGTGQFANAASTYLQLLGEAGTFALIAFVLLFLGLFRDLRAGIRAHPVLGAGLAGSVVALLICWVTDIVVTSEPVAACVGVLFGAVAAAGRQVVGPDSAHALQSR